MRCKGRWVGLVVMLRRPDRIHLGVFVLLGLQFGLLEVRGLLISIGIRTGLPGGHCLFAHRFGSPRCLWLFKDALVTTYWGKLE